MKQGLSLRVSQHLTLTPQLQQSIRLLQLSTLELQQEVEQMLDDNPFLERDDDAAPREEFGLMQADMPATADVPDGAVGAEPEDSNFDDAAPDWAGDGSVDLAPDDSEWGGEAPARAAASGEDEVDASELARSQESLSAFLQRQALALRLNELDRAALHYLIDSLNDDGYLEDSLEALAQGLAGTDAEAGEALLHHFNVALGLLQSLEPAGVGARDLGECLRLQLRGHSARPELLQLAHCICSQPLDLLARRDLRRFVQLCGAAEALVREALALIARLEPKPGRRFSDVARNLVVPDVLVTNLGGAAQPRFGVQINPAVLPRLRVHDLYASALRGGKGGGHAALQQRLQEARWFIKNIQQRFDTILRVSRAIVERQRSFLQHGALAMRPLVLREIADELGLHESTISRVTTAKYMATPQGTFELKYFFGSGLGTESGGQASSTAVRALIQQLVAAENPKKPLSDQKLADLLKEQGIECARRTVAKYREALKIAPTNLRKAL
jgi:RNA polymerase sigma-54 factor